LIKIYCKTSDLDEVDNLIEWLIDYLPFTIHHSPMRSILTLLKKDLTIEFRQQYALFGILLYVAVTIFILYLTINRPSSATWNGLFWVTQLFVATNAVAKSFLGESRGRQLYYYTLVSPAAYIISKLIGNVLLMLVLNAVSLMLYSLFLGSPVTEGATFLGISLLGGVSLALVFTLLSAIAAKAQQQASLMAILGFPVIIPQLVLLARLSKTAFGEVFRSGAVGQLAGLLAGLDGLIIVLAVILFSYLWKE
jgi:heme exporter protein B